MISIKKISLFALFLTLSTVVYAPYPCPDPHTKAQRLFDHKLSVAIHAGNLEQVKELLTNKDMLATYNESGSYSPLRDALTTFEGVPNLTAIIDLLVENSVGIHCPDIAFLTRIGCRCWSNKEDDNAERLKLSKILLERGVDPNISLKGHTPLDCSFCGIGNNPVSQRFERSRLLRLFLAHGGGIKYLAGQQEPYIQIFGDALPQQLLQGIVSCKNIKWIKSSIASGQTDPEVCDQEGRSAFFYAKNCGNGIALNLLLATHTQDRPAKEQTLSL
jgi:hypothetical protein